MRLDKWQKAFERIAGLTLGISAVLLGLLAIPEKYRFIPERWWQVFRVAAVVCGVIGIVCVAVLVLLYLTRPTSWLVRRATKLITIGPYAFRFSPASFTDLPQLHDLYARQFGGEAPTLQRMEAWWRQSGTSFWIVHDVRNPTKPVLVGSFKILPLTKDGRRALLAGEATGTTFEVQHIARNRKLEVAAYVGDVVANGMRARGAVLLYLQGRLQASHRSARPIYARPLTPQGLRAMTKLGFVCEATGQPPVLGKICVVMSQFTSCPSRSAA